MSRPVLLVLPLFVALLAPVDAKTAHGASDGNAALRYWQAFDVVPEWDEQEERLLMDWSTSSVNEKKADLLASADTSLRLFHRGATLQHCDWGLDYGDGPGILLPHMSHGRAMARLAISRAHYRFEKGQVDDAVDDVVAVLALARHLGADDFLISVLVEVAIERFTLDLVATYLPKFDPASLDRFTARLKELPDGGSLRDCQEVERKYMLRWMTDRLASDPPPEYLFEVMPELEEILKQVGSSAEAARLLGELEAYHVEAVKLHDLPLARMLAEIQTLGEKYEANPFASMMLPAHAKVYRIVARAEVLRAQLKAAIAVQRQGREALSTVADPFDGGAFAYRETPTGFELVSRFTYEGEPVTLRVGPPSPN